MCHREDLEVIYLKNVFFVKKNNGIEHVTNRCRILNDIRNKTIEELSKLNINTENKTFLYIIEYIYYNKKYTTNKNESQKDRRCIILIKNFINEMYISFCKNNTKKMKSKNFIKIKYYYNLYIFLVIIMIFLVIY